MAGRGLAGEAAREWVRLFFIDCYLVIHKGLCPRTLPLQCGGVTASGERPMPLFGPPPDPTTTPARAGPPQARSLLDIRGRAALHSACSSAHASAQCEEASCGPSGRVLRQPSEPRGAVTRFGLLRRGALRTFGERPRAPRCPVRMRSDRHAMTVNVRTSRDVIRRCAGHDAVHSAEKRRPSGEAEAGTVYPDRR